MVIWLAETPCGALKASQNPLWIYLIILIMNFLSYFYKSYGLICHHSNGFLISKDTPLCHQRLKKSNMNLCNCFDYQFSQNSVFIHNYSNGVLIGRDPLRGHQNFTKSISIYEIILIINLYINYFDNEFSLIFFIKRVYQYIILLMVFRTILTYFDLFYLLLPFLT